jgi:hypothetical protein
MLVKHNFKITSGFGLGIGSSVINGALSEIYASKHNQVDKYLCLRPFPQNISDQEERKKLYSKYREDMISGNGVAIFVFGNKKVTDSSGDVINSDGCREEFDIANNQNCLLIPIGSTGYMAKELLDKIKSNISDYPYLENYLDVLEYSMDADTLINTVLNIVENNRNM